MKVKIFTAIVTTSLLLSACGGNHGHPKAVDKLEEAEANALAKAPKAEEVKFDDHGQPTMGGVGGAAGANANTAPNTTEQATSDAAPADQAVADEQTPTADIAVASADTAVAVEAPQENATADVATDTKPQTTDK